FLPFASTRFLNVRTYVRHGAEAGIFFMAEFISNRLSVPLGPISYGLPYLSARSEYRQRENHDGERTGTLSVRRGPLAFAADWTCGRRPHPCRATLDEFLLERYSAFT